MNTNRLEWIDALKCFLILSVVCGHLIQYHSGISNFWDNSIWKILYSFHMPLFIFISGYLFKDTHNLYQSIKSKSLQLLLPGLTCAIIIYLKNFDMDKIHLINLKHILEAACLNLWYLKTLFVCILGGYFFFRARVKCIILFIVYWFFIRLGGYEYIEINVINNLLSAIGGGNGLFFLLPYFILGYLVKSKTLSIYIEKGLYIIIFFILWYIFIQYYNGFDTIYFSSPTWFSDNEILKLEIIKTLYRDLTAIWAILFLFILFKKYCIFIPSKIKLLICSIGSNTLGIYILQYLIIESNILNLNLSIFCRNSIICCFVAIFLVLILNIFVILLKKNKYVSLIMIGG